MSKGKPLFNLDNLEDENGIKPTYTKIDCNELLQWQEKQDKKLINRIKAWWQKRKFDKLYLGNIKTKSKEWKKMSRKEKKGYKRSFLLACYSTRDKLMDNLIKEAFNE